MKTVFIFMVAVLSINTAFGQKWQRLAAVPSGNALASVCFTDQLTGFAAGEEGTLLKTTDGGITWNRQNPGMTGLLNSICLTSAKTIHAVGGHYDLSRGAEGTILKTVNGGAKWEILGTNFILNSVYFTDAETGYAVGEYILKTINGGDDWTFHSLGLFRPPLHSVCFANKLNGFAAGSGGSILKTTDSGLNWQRLNSGSAEDLNSIFFITPQTGYVTGDHGTILKSTNGGIQWTTLISGTSSDLRSVFFVNENRGYAAGSDGVIIGTINGGITWTTIESGINNGLTSIYFTDDGTGYAVGEQGTVLKTLTDKWHGYGLEDMAGGPVRVKIFPNPACNFLTVETSENISDLSISVLSLSGREIIRQIISESITSVDISLLPPGMYIVKLFSGNGVLVCKIVKD